MSDETKEETQPGGGSEAGGDKITIEDLMHGDPFAEKPEAKTEGGEETQETEAKPEEKEVEAKETETETPETPETETPETPGTPETPESDSELSRIKFENEQLREQVRQLNQNVQALVKHTQGTQSQSQGQTPQGQGPQTPDIPPYEFEIPEEIMRLVDSDDERDRRVGMKRLLQGYARAIHKTVREHELPGIERLIKENIPQSPQTSQANPQQELARRIEEDYFSNFPDLKDPKIQAVNTQAWNEVMHSLHAQGYNVQELRWTPELRNRVGERARAIVRGMGGSTPQSTQPQPAPRSAPRRAPAQPGGGGGTRPASGPEMTEEEKLILDTIL